VNKTQVNASGLYYQQTRLVVITSPIAAYAATTRHTGGRVRTHRCSLHLMRASWLWLAGLAAQCGLGCDGLFTGSYPPPPNPSPTELPTASPTMPPTLPICQKFGVQECPKGMAGADCAMCMNDAGCKEQGGNFCDESLRWRKGQSMKVWNCDQMGGFPYDIGRLASRLQCFRGTPAPGACEPSSWCKMTWHWMYWSDGASRPIGKNNFTSKHMQLLTRVLVPLCLPACLPVCLPACLPACLPV
jgi:hypothetical protein